MLTITQSLVRERDYLTHEGACILANTIRAYWKLRGQSPKVYVERVAVRPSPSDTDRVSAWVVRSDIQLGQVQ